MESAAVNDEQNDPASSEADPVDAAPVSSALEPETTVHEEVQPPEEKPNNTENESVESAVAQEPSPPVVAAPEPAVAIDAAPSDDDDDDDLFGDDDDEDEQKNEPDSSTVDVSAGQSSAAPAPAAEDSGATSTEPTLSSSSIASETPDSPPKVASIPRKQPSTPNSDSNSPSKASSSSPSSFGLPPGAKIPKSVTHTILNGKLLDIVKSLPVHLINDALQEYDDAVDVKGSSIRNHGAYLYGVVKRYVSVQERASNGEGEGILPMGESLTPAVHARLEQLVTSGFCTREEMNDKVKSKIRMLSEKDALFALDELLSVERSSIRNFGSYFMGILNRYMRGDATSKARPPVHQDHPPMPHRNQQQQRGGRDRDRHYRDSASNSHPSDRDRSRDRYGNEPRPSHPYGPSQGQPYDNRQPAYSRQQQLPQQQWQPMNPQPPPMMQPNDRSIMVPHGRMQGDMNPNYNMPPPLPLPQQQPYQMQMNNNPSGNNSMFVSQGYNPQQPQQQQQPPYNANPTFYTNQQMMGGGPQQQQQQQYGMQPPMNQPPGSYQPQSPQMGYPPGGMVGPNFNTNPQGGGGMQGSYNQGPGGWQQQQQAPLDILGLADKAASAVQALSSQKGMMPHQQPPNNYQMPPVQQQPGQYQPYGGAPSGLPPMPPQQPPSYQAPMAPQFQQQQHHGGGDPFKRRTQARIEDLPISVQYAVQNIQATGAVEGPLDPGILGMIFDLPEHLALGALQRFAALDRSTMRNKTAYLAGLLRRELEKINRR